LKILLEEHISGKLDSNFFPYVADAPDPSISRSSTPSTPGIGGGGGSSMRSYKPKWQKGGGEREGRQRLIVFCAGGMTFGEMRACYEVGEKFKKDIIIGEKLLLIKIMIDRLIWTVKRIN
jgi:syntaxin-binding protein 1